MSQYDDDFWGNDDNESTGEAASGGGSFEVIPASTRCKAHIEEVEWGYYDPEDENIPYVKARWNIELPDDYENRKIFHDLKIYGENPKGKNYDANKQDKKIENARAMFWAIDKNCGGKLAALKRKPKNEELQRYLIGKPMYITLDVWEAGDKKGNWVRKIEPLSAGNTQPPQTKSAQKQPSKPQQQRNSNGGFDDMDDSIPF